MDHREFRVRSLGGTRWVSVYRPPGRHPGRHPGRLPVVYQADGGGLRYAEVVEAAIDDGRLPPLLLVGIEPGGLSSGRDRRADEYLYGMHRRRYRAHERFVLDTVIPWVQARHGATTDRAGTVIAGCSNGAAWALTMAHRYPGRFGAVAAFSVAGSEPRQVLDRPDSRVRHHLVVGTLEVDGINRTRDWAEFATAAGCDVAYRERTAGHDMCSWTEELPAALAWTLTTTRQPQSHSTRHTPP